ncbi:hypothetical protein [Bacillus sp. Marseille-P3800]|uniref:hypothetical protein n=1 Tax=Bacillus sp. Marseille-P3800 TaxID=2014782 RepID=UPI000C081D0B|nr:hypothetical protein [Bacillus sp. Marseille-P3800]
MRTITYKTENQKEYLERLSSLKTFNAEHKTYTYKLDNKTLYTIEYKYRKHKVKLTDLSGYKQLGHCECGLTFLCNSNYPSCKCGKKYSYFYDSKKLDNRLKEIK